MSFLSRFSQTPKIFSDDIQFHVPPGALEPEHYIEALVQPQNADELYNLFIYANNEFAGENVPALLALMDFQANPSREKFHYFYETHLAPKGASELNVLAAHKNMWKGQLSHATFYPDGKLLTLLVDGLKGNLVDTWSRYVVSEWAPRYWSAMVRKCPRVKPVHSLEDAAEQVMGLLGAGFHLPAAYRRMAEKNRRR